MTQANVISSKREEKLSLFDITRKRNDVKL